MKKKRAVLPFTLVAIVALSIAMLVQVLCYFSPLSKAIHITIAEMNSHPPAWVDRKVAIEGKLKGPFDYIMPYVPPYAYILYESSATADTIHDSSTAFIGLSWKSYEQFSLESVIVIGVVRVMYHQVKVEGAFVPYCYIEVQNIYKYDFLLPTA
jgi:hypothetical protein